MARAFIVIATTGTTLAQSTADGPTLVQIETGKVRGTATENVISFKGIPFAQPPVGALR
jgi:para-nitrobenzyl esterase